MLCLLWVLWGSVHMFRTCEKFNVDFSFCWFNLEVGWYSLEQNISWSCWQAFIYYCRLHQVWKGTGKHAYMESKMLKCLLGILRGLWVQLDGWQVCKGCLCHFSLILFWCRCGVIFCTWALWHNDFFHTGMPLRVGEAYISSTTSLLHMMWHCGLISSSYQGWVLFLVDVTSLSGAIWSRECSTAVLNESIAHDSDCNSSILLVLKCFENSSTVMEAVGLILILLVLFFGLFMLISM